MTRSKLSIAWLLLLLMPAIAVAQRDTVNRSRARGDADRNTRVERRDKRVRSVEKKSAKTNERPRRRAEKASRGRPSRTVRDRRADRNGRSKAGAVRRSDRRQERKTARNERSRRDGPARAPAVQRSRVKRSPPKVERRTSTARHRSGERSRSGVGHRPVERHKPVVGHRPVERHKPVKRHRPVVRHKAVGRKHAGRRFFHRFDRRRVKRYFYRDRRYHRPHIGGLSIGFFIRIPSPRWHVGASRRFVFRQVVTGHPAGALEVRSTFRRRIRHVRRDYVEVEFELDRIAVTAAGRFVGQVDRFPGSLRRIRAKIYSDGFVEFDRMLYVVGNQYAGFELLSTRYCGGDLIAATYGCLDPRSGELDFYRQRVVSTRYSRLLDPVQVGEVVPVALVPDEEYLGFQYVVGYHDTRDGYYSGSFDYSSLNSFDADGTAYRLSGDSDFDGFVSGNGPFDERYGSGFAHESTVSFESKSGGRLALRHRVEIRSLDH